jgi:hypothetical protein
LKSNSAIRTSFLVTTCFLNKYVISLLSQYGINNLDNINIVSDINGNTVGWTLGYLINQLNRDEFLPFESPPRRLSRDFFIPAITVASAFTVFFLFLFVFYLFRFNFKKERNYF